MVSPLELLAHFSKEIGGLEVTNVVTLICKLPRYWSSNPRIPQFIITMEEAQKKANRSGLPITNNWRVEFSASSLLLTNSFPNDCSEWDGKPKAGQTWKAWKETFKPLHKNLERKTRLARGEDSFGAAAAAQIIHGINSSASPAPFHGESRVLSEGANFSEDFNIHLENLATAATHGNEIVQGTLNQLTKSSTNHHNEIKKLLTELKSTLPSAGVRSNIVDGSGSGCTISTTQKETLKRSITQLQTAIKRKWFQGGFCCTHVHGVGYKHNSTSFSNQATVHINTATCENPAGPEANRNKGWDNCLLIWRCGPVERRLKLNYAFTDKYSLPPPTCSPTPNLLLSPKYS